MFIHQQDIVPHLNSEKTANASTHNSMLNHFCSWQNTQPSSRLHLLYANEGLNYSVMLPDFMSQQTRHSRPAASSRRLEMCSRLTSHYLDSSDPPGRGNTGDDALELAADRSFRWQIATVGCYGQLFCITNEWM